MVKPYYTHRKTPVLKSLFNKFAGIKRVHHKCFPVKYFFNHPIDSNNASE